MSEKIEVDETFEKSTDVVVLFKDGIYEKDCESLRMILGQAFPVILEKEEPKDVVMEKWLMRRVPHTKWNEETRQYEQFEVELVKDENLTELEKKLRKANILLSYVHSDEEIIQMIPKEQRVWIHNDLTWIYLESVNSHVSNIVDSMRENELISMCNIRFHESTTTIHTPQEDITGNYFTIRTVSNKSEEALKIGHKKIVQSLLEVLEPIDEIVKITYYCGDIEHKTESRISCVLD